MRYLQDRLLSARELFWLLKCCSDLLVTVCCGAMEEDQQSYLREQE
jgi:hypothetical protein